MSLICKIGTVVPAPYSDLQDSIPKAPASAFQRSEQDLLPSTVRWEGAVSSRIKPTGTQPCERGSDAASCELRQAGLGAVSGFLCGF